MKLDANYPRMMFHRSKDPVTVYSEDQEAALGPEWSRKIFAALSKDDKPGRLPDPDPEPEEEPDEDIEWEQPEEDPAEPETVEAVALPVKPKKARPVAHKAAHPAAHKRKG